MAGLLKFSVRLSGARASATALLGSQNEAVARTISVASFHTGKKLDQGTWKVPERLADIPDAEDPNFFNMVEYYFHRACVLAEDRLMKVGVYFLSRTKVAIGQNPAIWHFPHFKATFFPFIGFGTNANQ